MHSRVQERSRDTCVTALVLASELFDLRQSVVSRGSRRGRLWVEFVQNLGQILQLWPFVDIVDVDVADHSLFVDHDQSPLAGSVAAQYPVLGGNLAMWPEIGEKVKVKSSHRDLPCVEGRDIIGCNT